MEEKEEGRVHKCKICGKKKTSRKGLKMHKKEVHKEPAQEMDPEDNTSGKQKPDSFVSRLSKKTTGNTIRNNAGFMVWKVEKMEKMRKQHQTFLKTEPS